MQPGSSYAFEVAVLDARSYAVAPLNLSYTYTREEVGPSNCRVSSILELLHLLFPRIMSSVPCLLCCVRSDDLSPRHPSQHTNDFFLVPPQLLALLDPAVPDAQRRKGRAAITLTAALPPSQGL